MAKRRYEKPQSVVGMSAFFDDFIFPENFILWIGVRVNKPWDKIFRDISKFVYNLLIQVN